MQSASAQILICCNSLACMRDGAIVHVLHTAHIDMDTASHSLECNASAWIEAHWMLLEWLPRAPMW